jgi:hypothetical protein
LALTQYFAGYVVSTGLGSMMTVSCLDSGLFKSFLMWMFPM